MVKFLVFLVILCILFGVEATRAFIFGTFGFLFWAAVAIIGFCLLVNIYDELRDKRTPEQKKIDKEKNKGDPKANAFAYTFTGIILAVFIGLFIYYLMTK